MINFDELYKYLLAYSSLEFSSLQFSITNVISDSVLDITIILLYIT